MKKYRIICALSAVTALLSVSCSKENSSIESHNPEGAKTIQISISGEFSDFASTKASVESVFRMKWANSDAVYVYGTSDGSTISCLGTLTATVVSGSDSRVADLSGTITAPAADTKLTLVYSPLFSSAPSVSGGAITQSLAAQEGGAGNVTFVAYATVDYGGASASTYRTSFKFATSVLRVNVGGLDVAQELTSATISSVETACKLTINTDAEPAITGETSGNIVRSFTSVSTNANGNIAFYVALPVITANTGRTLSIVETASHTFWYPKFAIKAVATGGNMLNTIAAPVKYTENGIDLGYGTYIPGTGVIWAPVNCGYDADHTYGLIYQWGRKYGQAYETGTITPGTMSKSDDTEANKNMFGYNSSNKNWFSGIDNTLWSEGSRSDSDPCPVGWRVPTSAELAALIKQKSSWTTNTVEGVTQNGYWFSGQTTYSASAPRVFLPASGYRNQTNGNASARCSEGHYWSSSVKSTQAFKLFFIEDLAGTSPGYRAIGCSVRCVQE